MMYKLQVTRLTVGLKQGYPGTDPSRTPLTLVSLTLCPPALASAGAGSGYIADSLIGPNFPEQFFSRSVRCHEASSVNSSACVLIGSCSRPIRVQSLMWQSMTSPAPFENRTCLLLVHRSFGG